jgi:hypothetical protein
MSVIKNLCLFSILAFSVACSSPAQMSDASAPVRAAATADDCGHKSGDCEESACPMTKKEACTAHECPMKKKGACSKHECDGKG